MGNYSSIEDISSPEKLSEVLETEGFDDGVCKVFIEQEITGPEFLDLTQEDFEKMGLKMGPIKRLVRLQERYQPKKIHVSTYT